MLGTGWTPRRKRRTRTRPTSAMLRKRQEGALYTPAQERLLRSSATGSANAEGNHRSGLPQRSRRSLKRQPNIKYIVRKHVTVARTGCTSLRRKRVSPHCLRHALAMELLQSGVDRSVIALWLGHESPETTQIYLEADLALKEKRCLEPLRSRPDPDDIGPSSVVGIRLKTCEREEPRLHGASRSTTRAGTDNPESWSL